METTLPTYVEFRSDRFPACEGEEDQINPGLWGKRLAEFLRTKLHEQGIPSDEPAPEDWGWRLDLHNEDFELWVGCGRYQEHADGYLCFIEPHTPYVRKIFKKVDVRDRIAEVQRALEQILKEADGIRDVRWWTHHQFNNPQAE